MQNSEFDMYIEEFCDPLFLVELNLGAPADQNDIVFFRTTAHQYFCYDYTYNVKKWGT